MMNVPVTQYLAAQHREELLREAERERLARTATAGATSPAHHLLHAFSRHMLMRVRHTAHGNAATVTGTSPAELPA